ncbi:hypothetical protein COU74_03885 [Candidatus Peregrinibacteria bacterium CG10_big_fil_rev_8_21_14_0_10_36_19]|nr:MAG: hypothetical protein COU74_03885 [Candidatus Peregrinibacteria bacterium CG10_big_fil_rev_8_21_14_0_10_36_19]
MNSLKLITSDVDNNGIDAEIIPFPNNDSLKTAFVEWRESLYNDLVLAEKKSDWVKGGGRYGFRDLDFKDEGLVLTQYWEDQAGFAINMIHSLDVLIDRIDDVRSALQAVSKVGLASPANFMVSDVDDVWKAVLKAVGVENLVIERPVYSVDKAIKTAVLNMLKA